jgi:hypothetical protein
MAYLGKTPSQAVRSRYYFTATGGETSLSGADDNSNTLTFTDGNYVDVYLNGVLLVAATDYNTTTANTIAGLVALAASDVVEIVVYDTFSVFSGNVTGDFTVGGAFTSQGIDDNATSTAMTLDSSGRVGIGTTSPSEELTILKSDDARVSITSSATSKASMTGLIEFDGSDGRHGYIGPVSGTMTINTDGGYPIKFQTAGTERMRLDSSGNVGIGTTPQSHYTGYTALDLGASGSIWSNRTTSDTNTIMMANNAYLNSGATSWLRIHADEATRYEQGSGLHRWSYAASGSAGSAISWSEAMRIDPSGNLLVGKTSSAFGTAGVESSASGGIWSTRSVFQPASFNLLSNDGPIAAFYKDSALVGTIGSRSGNLYIGSGDTTLKFEAGGDYIVPASTTGADRDNAIDLGNTATQFKNLFLSGGVYLGGTGSANKLDDYEEGTWTGSVTVNGFTQSISSISGRYTKIGRFVECHYVITLSPGGYASGYSLFTGLPFTAVGASQVSGYYGNGNIGSNGIGNTHFVQGGSTQLYLYPSTSTANSITWEGSFRYIT